MFAVELVRTGNQTAAYRKAYKCDKMKENAINVEASRLSIHPMVALRLASLRAEARKESGITLQEHLSRLNRLGIKAEQVNQFGAAVTAEMARGKVSGHYVDRVANADGSNLIPPRIEIVLVRPK
jgi:hypothetical protein